MKLDPNMTFEEAIRTISDSHRPGSLMGGTTRNRMVEAWGQLAGRTRALASFDQALASYTSMAAMSRALQATPTTLKYFRQSFAALPDDRPRADALRRGSIVGGWRLDALLGRGGNCEVWKATHQLKGVGALKTPHQNRLNKEGVQRFEAEVKALQMLDGVTGVLPLLDHHLPPAPSRGDRPYLLVPVATGLAKHLEEAQLREIIEAVSMIAETLAKMHVRGISHRDVKPDNLYWLESLAHIGDLGLVSYPGKTAVTTATRKLGPTFFIAPEMLNTPHEAKGPPADVYSLSKTLWVLATGMNFPVPGQLRGDDKVTTLGTYVEDRLARPLQPILEECTSNTPASRPTARDVALRLHRLIT